MKKKLALWPGLCTSYSQAVEVEDHTRHAMIAVPRGTALAVPIPGVTFVRVL